MTLAELMAISLVVGLFLLKAKGFNIGKEDLILSIGIVLLSFQYERHGADYVIDSFINLFIAITIFDFIRTKIKKWEEK